VPVPDGPLDEATVDLYLYWHRERHADPDPDVDQLDLRRTSPATAARPATPPVSPALLEAASFAYRPEPCPTCATEGAITYVDLDRGVQRQQCPECGRRWMSPIARASETG
jgi:hypothetical protein